MPDAALTAKQQDFVRNYIDCRNALKAYRWSYDCHGMQPATVAAESSKMLAHPGVKAAIAALMVRATEPIAFVAEDWLRHNVEIATADPNDLIRSVRVCCRHCHGLDGAWQWRTHAEYLGAVNEAFRYAAAHPDDDVTPPTDEGGYGFDKTRPPNADCQACDGIGEFDVFIADSGKLQGAARRLYAGLKQGRDGITILMRDQDKALSEISKYFGLTNLTRHEIAGKNGGPIITAQSLSDEHLAQIVTGLSDKNL
jgi:phage terminase small subunit